MPDSPKSGERAGNSPERIAQLAMRRVQTRRFFKQASVVETEAGHTLHLDGRQLKTPEKRPFILPGSGAAELAAREWNDLGEYIDPAAMPVTRMVNTAIDAIAGNESAVAEDILGFSCNDLICYRADYPEGLAANQAALWDPLLDWLETANNCRLVPVTGIVHLEQNPAAIAAFRKALARHEEALRLSCLHTMTTLTGSAVIALALAEGGSGLDEAWRAAHVDEDWNIAQWGEDLEAAKRRAARLEEMTAAYRLFREIS